jgi:hypothetical protein
MRPVNGAFQRAALIGLCLFLVWGTLVAAEDGTTSVEGTILDAAGDPVPECRVVVRLADGVEVFISSPSDRDGRYAVVVPSGENYVIVALVAPNGARVTPAEPERLRAEGARVSRDLTVPTPVLPRSRRGGKQLGGADRLFLSFVEDPALVGRQHWEVQAASARDYVLADFTVARVIAAFTYWELPRVEFGARAGYGEIKPPGAGSETGATDLDLWGKYHLHRSEDGRWDVAIGALLTLPTGDEDAGLGLDAAQAEWFGAASRAFDAAVLVGHVGVATSEDGRVRGISLDGQVAASAGLGVIVTLSREASLVFEASYDGARFERTDSDALLLTGFNWQVHWRGKLRAALAAGLADSSADAELIVSYAVAH